MRPNALAPLLAAAILALPGCGASDEAARNAFREASVQGCLSASRGQAPAALANFDWERLCNCATEKVMEGKSAAELAQLRPGDPSHRAIVAQCVAEIQAGAPAPAPATNTSG